MQCRDTDIVERDAEMNAHTLARRRLPTGHTGILKIITSHSLRADDTI